MGLLVLSAGSVYAQQTVRGRVTTAEDAQPIAGVQVVVQNTSTLAITDGDGRYSINVPQPASAVLNFSFMGYTTAEEAVGARTEINVALAQAAETIDDVIVLGYTSVRKTELTSSVVSLSSEQLTDVVTPDIGSMLQGKAAGVMITGSGQPGDEANIRIRGTGSITASAAPLYVVDGVPSGRSYSGDPSDVETLTVLKDIGATAIYGADGAGGVIVITTKSARRNEDVRVNVRATYGVKNALFGRFAPANSSELYNFQKLYFPNFETARPETLLDQDFSWLDAFFNTGQVQNYYASVSGGGQKSNFMVSASHYNEEGTALTTQFKRSNVRLNINTQITDWLNMTVRANYQEGSRSSSLGFNLDNAYRALPWDIPYDERTGELIFIDDQIRPDNGQPWYSINKWNALHNAQYNYNNNKSYRTNGNIVLNATLTPWLSASTSNNFSRSFNNNLEFIDPRANDTDSQEGMIEREGQFNTNFRTSNLLKAAYEANGHSINAVAGFEYSKWINDEFTATGEDFPAGLLSLAATSSAKQTVEGYASPGATWSALGQVQYTYNNKYFFTASFRADASSKFAAQNRVGYFPSVTGGWLVSDEPFMEDNNIFTMLKLRASWGMTGNSNIEDFQYMDTYEFNGDYLGSVGARPGRMSNPNLGWESATMFSGGIDFSLYNRVDISLDFYNNMNKDLLLNVPQAPSSGFLDRTQNMGEIRNRGIEIAINSTNIQNRDFTWTTAFNIGFNRNKVMYLPVDFIDLTEQGGVNQRIQEGQDMFTWFMPDWMGVDPDNGDPLWYGALYTGEGEDRVKVGEGPTSVFGDVIRREVGSATPDFTGGLYNTLRYKNWTLGFNFTFTYGNLIYHGARRSMDADGAYSDYNSMSHDNGLGWVRWEKPGDIATHPMARNGGNKSSNEPSSRWLEDGSFLRLRNLSLSYDLPKTFLQKLDMTSARIYATGDNLMTISKYSGSDPEVNLTSDGDSPAGFVNHAYPVGRTISFGVEVNF
jgi:TonB-linked SusC/RagA family outer membrane protein